MCWEQTLNCACVCVCVTAVHSGKPCVHLALSFVHVFHSSVSFCLTGAFDCAWFRYIARACVRVCVFIGSCWKLGRLKKLSQTEQTQAAHFLELSFPVTSLSPAVLLTPDSTLYRLSTDSLLTVPTVSKICMFWLDSDDCSNYIKKTWHLFITVLIQIRIHCTDSLKWYQSTNPSSPNLI